jgi:oligopeptide/dipeptide ABC transporter ATP-binding protein
MMQSGSDLPILEVEDLRTHLHTRRGVIKAVDGLSFSVARGESLGLVGESGCGKSMTLLSLLRLVPQPGGRIVGGRVLLEGRNLLDLEENEMRKVRGSEIAMILQDPMTSLDPLFTIGDQVVETLRAHGSVPNDQVRNRAGDLLSMVRIPAAKSRLRDYPHQLSGGMRQRTVAAIALAGGPKLLLADEPTTALDVTIQMQFLALLKEIQAQSQMAIITVTHDFGIVARLCTRVAVMYAGRIVEMADVRTIFRNPLHPYTQGLINSVPRMGRKVEVLASVEGQPPDLAQLPVGCHFAPRCPHAMPRCLEEYPAEFQGESGQSVRCWLYE